MSAAEIKVGLLGLSQREGTFSEVGLRSWRESGCQTVERVLLEAGEGVFFIHRPLVVRSARSTLERVLRDWCDAPDPDSRCDLILTVGGIGLSPADAMADAAEAAITRSAPGISGLIRHHGLHQNSLDATMSRGVAGVRGRTLIINLPHSEPELLRVLDLLVPHLPTLVAAAQDGTPPGDSE